MPASHPELEGEQEFVVLPLPTPGVQAFKRSGVQAFRPTADAPAPEGPTPERLNAERLNALMSYPSVQLFADRAQAARPGFQLTLENAAAVAALCDRLEGLPLAIELAAARAGVLTPQQMLARLAPGPGPTPHGAPAHFVGGRFELLVSPRRDVSARHRTLRAAMEWSYRLLAPELQRFLAQLSVFCGTWTLEAAEAVCGEGRGVQVFRCSGVRDGPPERLNTRTPEHLTLEYLEELRACSLVVAEPAGPEMRYRLLETVREFAAEQLTPEQGRALQERHFAHYLAFAESLQHLWPTIGGHEVVPEGERRWLAQHEAEYSNVRAALEWGLTVAPAEALRLVDCLTRFWYVRGYVSEALEFIRRAVQWRSEETTELRARALRYAGEFANFQGEYEQAQTFLEEALALGRASEDPWLIATVLNNLGEVAAEQGEYDRARRLFQESFEIYRSLEHGLGIVWPLTGLAEVARALGEYEAARAHAERGLAIYRWWGDRRRAAQRLRDLGHIACCQGEHERAERLFKESLPIFREFGDQADIGLSLKGLGDVALAEQDYAAARTCYRECLTVLRDLGFCKWIAAALEGFARLAAAEGQSERACQLLGAAQALREAIGSPLPPNERPEQEARRAALRAALGEAEFNAAWRAGRAMPIEHVIAEALAGDQ